MSSRWVCAACGGWCELLNHALQAPEVCPYSAAIIPEWEDLDEDEEEEEEEE